MPTNKTVIRQCGWDDKQGAARECHGDNSGQILWLVASSTTVVLPQATTCFAVLTAIPLERNTWGNERPRWWMSNLIQCNIFFVRPGKVRIPRYKRYNLRVLDMYWNTGPGSLYHCNDLALYKIGQSVGGNESLNAHLELLGPCFDTHRGQCVNCSSLSYAACSPYLYINLILYSL